MGVTRRDLAIAGALALSASSLLHSTATSAEPAEQAVDQAVEALRKAIFEQDKAGLEKLTAAPLSYGHSDGRVQTKPEFIEGVMTRKATVKSLAFPRTQGGARGRRRDCSIHVCLRIRSRWHNHEHQAYRPHGLAKAGWRLETLGAPGLQAGLSCPPPIHRDAPICCPPRNFITCI